MKVNGDQQKMQLKDLCGPSKAWTWVTGPLLVVHARFWPTDGSSRTSKSATKPDSREALLCALTVMFTEGVVLWRRAFYKKQTMVLTQKGHWRWQEVGGIDGGYRGCSLLTLLSTCDSECIIQTPGSWHTSTASFIYTGLPKPVLHPPLPFRTLQLMAKL